MNPTAMRVATIAAALILSGITLYWVFVQHAQSPAHVVAACLAVLIAILVIFP